MKHSSTLFLKFVLIFMGAGVLTGLLWFPKTEGRAVNLDLISIYTDPFILYIYIASTPFFFALYQAFKLLGYIEQNQVFTQVSINALRNIKYCAIAVIAFLIGAGSFIMLTHGEDDPAGALALGMVMTFASSVVATAAAVFQKMLQKAVDIKSENDLTV